MHNRTGVMSLNDIMEKLNGRRGRGRPKKEESRGGALTIRLSDEEESMLKHLEIESDDNKSDIMRKALRMYYGFKAKRW